MQNRLCKILIFFALSIILISCSKGDDELTIINVEKEFRIDIKEVLSPEKNDFELVISTIRAQECENAVFDISQKTEGAKVEVRINGINKPTDCDPGFTPIIEHIPFNFEIGQAVLKVDLRDDINNNGTITINKFEYGIQMETEDGIEVSHKMYGRIPDQILWGYFTSENGTSLSELSTIVAEFKALGSLNSTDFLDVRDYLYFDILDNGSVLIKDISNELENPVQFIFQYNTNTDIQSILTAIKQVYPFLIFNVKTSDGRIYS